MKTARCNYHRWRCRSWWTVVVLACVVQVAPASQQDAARFVLDPSHRSTEFQGWGTSLAWWANVSGAWEDEQAFDAMMDAVFDPEKGLGLTIVRLNIGAGQNPDKPDGYMHPGRLMPAYRPGPDMPYDFEADRAQQRALLAGIARGVEHVEANANSPPWWMTMTGDSSGNGKGSNLAPEHYAAFCEYLAEIASWYKTSLGIEFSSITPLNEPSATWWDGDGNQEGCTFARHAHPPLLLELRKQLDKRGLTSLPVSGPEEWSADLSVAAIASYPREVQAMLSHLTTHTYGTRGRAELNQLSEELDKPLWVSEYGTGAETEFASAIGLARQIIDDFREMPRLEAWIIWQVLSTNHFRHTWACMLSDFKAKDPTFELRPQYHAYRQFTRFVRPGCVMIASGDRDALAAFHPDTQQAVIVMLNDSLQEQARVFDLSAFENLPQTARRWSTTRIHTVDEQPALSIVGGELAVRLEPESIVTLVIEGVSASSGPQHDTAGD